MTHEDYISHLTSDSTRSLLTCCMHNLQDEDIVATIMRKVQDDDMFADELESAIQNYAAGLDAK